MNRKNKVPAYASGVVKLTNGNTIPITIDSEVELVSLLDAARKLHESFTLVFRAEASGLHCKLCHVRSELVERVSLWSDCEKSEKYFDKLQYRVPAVLGLRSDGS